MSCDCLELECTTCNPHRLPWLLHGPREQAIVDPPTIAGLERALEAVRNAPPEPDPMHALMTEHLNRLAATFHPGGRFECPVTGCSWAVDVPAPELVEAPLLALGFDGVRGELRYIGAPREQVELHLVLHIDAHATDGAPPPVDPPEPDPWNAP